MGGETIFIELSLIILVAFIVSSFVRVLRQPLIIGYIISGIIVGPYFLNLVQSSDSISGFAQIGVSILLFMVGINLNPKVIKDVGKISVITGLGQIIFTFIIGFFLAKFLGFNPITSAYIAIAIAFSSTIIIMKLLIDKGEINSLHGRISIGFLIVQDLIAIAVIIIISSLSGGENILTLALNALIKGSLLISGLFLFSYFALPRFTRLIAKSQELLLLFSVTWAFAISILFYYFGFSFEIGALLAGITLSLSPYKYEIGSRIKPLRDFFVLMFFLVLGSQMVFTNITDYIIPTLVFSAFILVGNTFIVTAIMGLSGYTKRNSFLSGLAVSQISEFSFIIIALGVSLGHLSTEIISFMTFIGLITIAGSTYAILYSGKIYNFLSTPLSLFERKKFRNKQSPNLNKKYDIILFGHNRIGYDLVKTFTNMKNKFLVVDFNPDIINDLIKKGIDCQYGDVGDSELLDELNLRNAKMVISTVPDFETNSLLINKVKSENKNAIIIMISHQIDEAIELYKLGASYVVMPHFLGGRHTSKLIEDLGLNKDKFLKQKKKEIESLKERKSRGHEHPLHNRD